MPRTPIKTPPQKLGPKEYGFWHYDKFPYVLGSIGRRILSGYNAGCFKSDKYGGSCFSGAVTMPIPEGRLVQARLDAISEGYGLATAAIHRTFYNEVKVALSPNATGLLNR